MIFDGVYLNEYCLTAAVNAQKYLNRYWQQPPCNGGVVAASV